MSKNIALYVRAAAETSGVVLDLPSFNALVQMEKVADRVYLSYITGNGVTSETVGEHVAAVALALFGTEYATNDKDVDARVASLTEAAEDTIKASMELTDEAGWPTAVQIAQAEVWLALDNVDMSEHADAMLKDEWKANRKRVMNRVRNGLNSTLTAMTRADGGAETSAAKTVKSADERIADVIASVRRALGDGVTVDAIQQAVVAAIAENAPAAA